MGHRTHREISNYIEGYIDTAHAKIGELHFVGGRSRTSTNIQNMNYRCGAQILSRSIEERMEKEEKYMTEGIKEKEPRTILWQMYFIYDCTLRYMNSRCTYGLLNFDAQGKKITQFRSALNLK
jgi:hypothetical protein